MAVGPDMAVPRKVLAAVGHAGAQQTVHQALGQHRDDARIAVEGAVADHAAAAEIEIEHRRETQVDAAGAQLGAEHMADCGCRIGGIECVDHPALAEHAHRRQVREAVAAEALHPATLVVDAHQHVRPLGLDLCDELGELAPVLPVAREQDQPAGQRVAQATPVIGGQRPCRRRRARAVNGSIRRQACAWPWDQSRFRNNGFRRSRSWWRYRFRR